jgi:hypothetical protein
VVEKDRNVYHIEEMVENVEKTHKKWVQEKNTKAYMKEVYKYAIVLYFEFKSMQLIHVV